MTKLNAKARNKLPKMDFALPGSRAYPIEDAAHAKNAKARASAQHNKGAITSATLRKIDAAANKKLCKGKKKDCK